jgi:hypothetical protein
MQPSRNAVLENVRRYRAIASLYRQTAAFRPHQSHSLLGHAKDWENRALMELESYFMAGTLDYDRQRQVAPALRNGRRWPPREYHPRFAFDRPSVAEQIPDLPPNNRS